MKGSDKLFMQQKDIYGACDNCGDVIFSVLGNPEDALILHFEGGYGCYIDPMDVDYNTVVICKNCSDQMSILFPRLGNAMRKG